MLELDAAEPDIAGVRDRKVRNEVRRHVQCHQVRGFYGATLGSAAQPGWLQAAESGVPDHFAEHHAGERDAGRPTANLRSSGARLLLRFEDDYR